MRRGVRCFVGLGEGLSADGESAAVKPGGAFGGCFGEEGSLGGRGMRGSGAGREMAVPRMPKMAGGEGGRSGVVSIAAGTGVSAKSPEVCNGRPGGTMEWVHALRLEGSFDSMAFADFLSLSFPGGGRQLIVNLSLRGKVGLFPFLAACLRAGAGLEMCPV